MQHAREAMTREDDARLLAACMAGDEAAWTELVARYTRLVYSIALQSGLTDEDAADVVQTVFTIVLRRLESLERTDRFSSWLITIARRESWAMRRLRRDDALGDIDAAVDPGPTAETLVADWEQASLIHRALHRLDARCRTLIDMLFLRDPRPPYEAISAELGIAVGSIGPIRARCLKRLRERLDDLGVVGAG